MTKRQQNVTKIKHKKIKHNANALWVSCGKINVCVQLIMLWWHRVEELAI